MKYFLFDIGNVLTNFNFPHLLQTYADHSGQPLGPQTDRDEEMYLKVETGELSEPDYVDYLNEAKGLSWTTDNLHMVWQEMFSLNTTGMALLEKAKESDAAVYTLSNIANYHERAIEHNWSGFFDGMDGYFMSYKMGVRKPDARIYEMVLEKLGVSGDQCFFIDDLADNIASARAVGIEGHQFIPENYTSVVQAAHEFFDW
ncbi:HAD family phosphatase [Pontiellaceae bacterium B12227]|nr:HAD family phosphatase [Pontiellaceae bacterium B12227]